MKLVEWDEKLSVGDLIIDKQHKTLIRMINKLIRNRDSSNQYLLCGEILSDLLTYIHRHFTDEEDYLRKKNYPYIEEHKVQHSIFSNRVGKFTLEVMENRKPITDELVEFLSKWMIDHISREDQDYKNYIDKN